LNIISAWMKPIQKLVDEVQKFVDKYK
jgi:hypothetical protein